MFENLLNDIFENPLFWALIVGFIRNISGYIENVCVDRTQKYDSAKLAETFVSWITVLTLVSQWLPLPAAVGVSFVIDVLRTAIKSLKK